MALHYVLSLQRCRQQKASNDIIESVLSGFIFLASNVFEWFKYENFVSY